MSLSCYVIERVYLQLRTQIPGFKYNRTSRTYFYAFVLFSVRSKVSKMLVFKNMWTAPNEGILWWTRNVWRPLIAKAAANLNYTEFLDGTDLDSINESSYLSLASKNRMHRRKTRLPDEKPELPPRPEPKYRIVSSSWLRDKTRTSSRPVKSKDTSDPLSAPKK